MIILKKYDQCNEIKEHSTEILKFLVNDILDFGQLRAGKFRKIIYRFNVETMLK